VDGLAAGSEPPVLAASDGIVESAGGTGEHIPSDQCQPPFPQGSLGTFVTLKHENGFETKYGHLKAGKTLEVRKNGTAKEGEVFDVMDDTGCSSGVHLHFQVVYGGTSFKSDSLRIFIEGTRIEDYCKTDNLGNACKYPSTNNGRPFGNIDLPFKHDIVRGTVNVSGWALDDGSISFIKFLIDGTTVAIGNYGVARPDVCTFAPTGAGLPPYTWPGFTTCPNIGFNGSFDSTMIPDGLHALDVAATDNRGAERIIDRHMIRVNNR